MRNSFLAQLCVYTAIIFGVMFWSGIKTERTVYHRYRVSTEGLELPVSDKKATSSFYHEVLNLSLLEDRGVILPDGKRLTFVPSTEKITYVLRVRNGFDRLYEEISRRSKSVKGLGKIGNITSTKEGREFRTTDPHGNVIVFFQPKWRSSNYRNRNAEGTLATRQNNP